MPSATPIGPVPPSVLQMASAPLAAQRLVAPEQPVPPMSIVDSLVAGPADLFLPAKASARHQWPALPNVLGERLIQLPCILLFSADLNLNSRCRHLFYRAPGYQRIGITHREHDPRNSRSKHLIHAGRRASMMTAWLQIDVQRSAACPVAGFIQSMDLSV